MAANPIATPELETSYGAENRQSTTRLPNFATSERRSSWAAASSGSKSITRRGMLTARERVEKLVDQGKLPGDRRFREASLHLLWHGGQGIAGGWSGHGMRNG